MNHFILKLLLIRIFSSLFERMGRGRFLNLLLFLCINMIFSGVIRNNRVNNYNGDDKDITEHSCTSSFVKKFFLQSIKVEILTVT